MTIRSRINWAMPALLAWAQAGHCSLREISRDDVIKTLPPSGNPHLFVNHRTTTGIACVGGRWFGLKVGVAARVLREDRILDEAQATGGDVRRLCDLFGISINAASRYAQTIDHAGFAKAIEDALPVD